METAKYINEVWKPIIGYVGLYEVSNFGRVRSLDRLIYQYKSGKALKKGKILTPQKDTIGYLHVRLYKDGKTKTLLVHRLVAEAFIPNPNRLPEVNHKNQIKDDNRVENLEWSDRKYQMNYSDIKNRIRNTLTNRKDHSKPVCQYTLDGVFVARYPSVSEAGRQVSHSFKNISACCLGNKKTAYGYIWKYAD